MDESHSLIVGSQFWAEKLAQEICAENSWPYEEPIEIICPWFSKIYQIRTNAKCLGMNVVIETDKHGRVLNMGFLPR